MGIMSISPSYALEGAVHNKATLTERVKTQFSGTYASPNLILFMIALSGYFDQNWQIIQSNLT